MELPKNSAPPMLESGLRPQTADQSQKQNQSLFKKQIHFKT